MQALNDTSRDSRPDGASKPAGASRKGVFHRVARQPLAVLALAIAVLPLALIVTLVMPIGPMFWDHYIYLDAANRIFDGQIPSVDFFTPAGGLGYYLFATALWVFPQGHPLLLASWSLLAVTVPLMAIVILDVQKRSVSLAYALLLPFLLFALLPFNTADFYPYPGSDGFGIYNRQVCQLLYVLAAGLLFVDDRKKLIAVTALAMLALLFIKITGVAAGVILCVTAVAAGRLPLRAAIVAGVLFVAVIAGLEAVTGMVSAYAGNIMALLGVNDESLLPRLFQAASLNFGFVFLSIVLAVLLLASDADRLLPALKRFVKKPDRASLQKGFDHGAVWLAAFLAAGLLFESQNTGSQAFIFLWPLLLRIAILARRQHGSSRFSAVTATLILAIALPPAVYIVQKAARAWVGTVNNTRIESTNLKTLGAVGFREMHTLRAERMRNSYIDSRATYSQIALSGELPGFLLYSDYDFQLLWLQTTDEAVSAILAYEKERAVRFETMMLIDFTNPFPWLMDRHAPRHIAIGADPYRAVPQPDAKVNDAVANADIALYPTCPVTAARMKLLSLYQPALDANHTRLTLTPCFDAFVRKDLIASP